MKRTTLILMTVLMLAALDGGNVSPSLAQTENACPLFLEISGASGRSVCEDTTFEGWTWTAPATGPVTFNTRGSDMTLELIVHTFDPVFTEVATATDEVHFTAQQGVEYTIYASADDEATAGSIVLNWRAGSTCGNGGTSLVGSSDETGLREAVFDDPDPGEPAYVLAGPKARIWYWATDDAVTQSLYVSTDGSVSVRTFHDADGLPSKVIDECTGDWMLIQRYDDENIDFWFYDADGNYQSGLAVFEFEGNYYHAEIDGVPAHAGKRITGTLRPTGASWTGSYTLEVDMPDIQDAQPVSDAIAALINGLSSDGTGRRGMVPGWQSRFATVLGPLGAWLSPEIAVAQHAATFRDAMFYGGAFMLGAGLTGIAAPAIGAAGAVMGLVGALGVDVSQGQIRPNCPDSPEMAHALCHGTANHFARPGERGLIGLASDIVHGGGEVISGAANVADRVRQVLADAGTRALSDIRRLLNPPRPPQAEEEPIRRIPDDNPSETVSGTMMDGTTTVDVTGTVTPDGDFDVADDDGEVQLQLSIGGGAPVEGSFEWDGVEGEVEVDPLSDFGDWEADDDTTTTDDEQDDLEAARRAAEEAMRSAEEAARELDETNTDDDNGETDDELSELDDLLAELEETRRQTDEARRPTRQVDDGTSTTDTTSQDDSDTDTGGTPSTPNNNQRPNEDGCWIPCTPDPTDTRRCLPNTLGKPGCMALEIQRGNCPAGYDLCMTFTNNCGGRLYVKSCIQSECPPGDSLCYRDTSTAWWCNVNGVRSGEKWFNGSYDSLSKYPHTGVIDWLAVGSNKPVNDWNCANLLPEWDAYN